MELKELREKRLSLVHQQRDLFERAKNESRNLTTDEHEQFQRIETDLKEIRQNIETKEALVRNLAELNEQEQPAPAEQRQQVTHEQAYAKYLRSGMSALNEQERSLMVQHRGTDPQSTTDAEGGYTIPQGFSNELFEEMALWGGMFQAARVFTTATGNPIDWPTVDDTSAVATLVAENATVAVQDMTFGNKVLNSYLYNSGIVKISVQLAQDSAFDLGSFLNRAFARRLGSGINAALTTADGSSKPQGFVPAATAYSTGVAAAAITRDNIVDLIHQVDPAYRVNGRLMFNDATLAYIKKLAFGSADDRPLWQPSIREGEPDTLEGFAYTINQDMASIGASAKSIAFGDFDKYIIRVAGQPVYVRLVERYMDALQYGYMAYLRVDGELLSANAIKVLQHASS